MADQPRTRQELYDRIRQSSKDAVILEEMIRLGFWPEAGVLPEDPAEEIRRRGELEGKLRALRTEHSRLKDVNALKKAARRKRMAESRQRRKETKERRRREREERAAAWREHKKTHIDFLGEGVSGGLSHVESDVESLRVRGLQPIHTAAELAEAMGTSVGELRFLAFTRAATRVAHYVQFTIPKKTGGRRFISAPKPRLKGVQYWILDNILAGQKVHDAAHGFVTGRSIVSNARPHVGTDVVVNLDLKDFFPTLTYNRVKGLFRWMGYSESLATILGLLCTEPRRAQVDLDGVSYHVALEKRVLPQGAPTSPAITNLICKNLDSRIEHICDRLGFTYTRYADDLSFSGKADADVGKLLRQVRHIVVGEGFVVHPDKTRVLRRAGRQQVTGIVVNEFPNIDRKTLRRFRATLFQIEKDDPDGKRWGSSDDVIAAVEGFANYVAMVNPEKGAPLQERARALVAEHGKQPAPPKRPRPTPKPPVVDPPELAAEPETENAKSTRASKKAAKKKKWWKFWE